MADIKFALDSKSRDKFKDVVSALMKACEVIGAGRVVHACRYILESISNSTAGIVTGYPELIEKIIELKRHIRRYLAQQGNFAYTESPDVSEVLVGEGFVVVYNKDTDYYHCILRSLALEEQRQVDEESKR